ncbi:MAG TPA: inositol monophosphatase family protein [Candidatus Bathyarchaeia archaeon]|nr:inositol monophosphatase family protein [Candidatus Bathyarchaeia archaeon]
MVFSNLVSESFREVAVDAALRAGAFLRTHFGTHPAVSYKGSPTNLVTEMDRGAEAIILDAIRARFPGHGVLAEESGARPGAGTHRWIVDPLDGTTNYAHGFPIYGVSIALEIDGVLTVGVVYDPSREECFLAERGRGATLNGKALHVSSTTRLAESLLGTSYPNDLRGAPRNNLAEHGALMLRCRSVRSIGSAVLGLAAVAAGRLDGYWEQRLGAWDVAAGALLIREAGGRATAVSGGPLDLDAPSIAATNSLVHEELLDALQEVASAR